MIAWLYKKIFIAIVPDGGVYEVRAVSLQQKKVLHKESARFESSSAFEDMVKFVRKQIDDSPYHYIAVLNPDLNQGAISGCSLHDVIDEIGGAKTICRNEKWLLYASLLELESLKKTYAPIGLDYVFSPFSIIENFFADKIGGGFGLYALAQKDAFSVVFFDEGKLEYAHHYPMHRKLKENVEEVSTVGFTLGVEEEDIQKSAEIDEISSLDDLELIEELDSLSDIEDLDELEEIADFSEDDLTLEEKRLSSGHSDEIKFEMDQFNEDYERFEFIQKTLAHFYASEQCKNRFVETVYIADAYGNGSELKRYLEEELFLSVLIRRIDLGDEVISLSMSEEESR